MKITNWFPLVRLLHVPPVKKSRSQLKSRFTIFGKIVIKIFFGLKQNAEHHTGVHSQIEFTLRRATEAELL